MHADPHDRDPEDDPDPVLRELTQIVGAFYLDMKQELDGRDG